MLALAGIATPAHAQAPGGNGTSQPSSGRIVYLVKPSEADPGITAFNEPNYVVLNRAGPADPKLLVFLPGTNGAPLSYALVLLVAADAGYRSSASSTMTFLRW